MSLILEKVPFLLLALYISYPLELETLDQVNFTLLLLEFANLRFVTVLGTILNVIVFEPV